MNLGFSSEEASALCERLSFAQNIPRSLRNEARNQLYKLVKKSSELFPSWYARQLDFVPPAGYRPMNCSVTRFQGKTLIAVRCTNYYIDSEGPHPTENLPNWSQNYLGSLSDDLVDGLFQRMSMPEIVDCPVPGAPSGCEDCRIFEHDGELWGIMVRCDQNQEAWPEQWLGTISMSGHLKHVTRLRSPFQRTREKNWIPVPSKVGLLFIYSHDPTVAINAESKMIASSRPPVMAEHLRGSSQGIPFRGGTLALVHAVTLWGNWPKNIHRFAWYDDEWRLARLSPGFLFPSFFKEEYLNGYQYGMGLCWHPDEKRILVSYSVGDGQSWVSSIESDDVASSLRGF
jgi:hypothetical protein